MDGQYETLSDKELPYALRVIREHVTDWNAIVTRSGAVWVWPIREVNEDGYHWSIKYYTHPSIEFLMLALEVMKNNYGVQPVPT